MTESQRIYELLVAEAASVGEHHVHAACKMFKKSPKGDVERGRRQAIPKAWIEKAWLRQRGRCNICKREMLLSEAAGDHIRPWSSGGAHASGNIAAVHDAKFQGIYNCNQEKGARGLMETSKMTGHLLNEFIPSEEDA